MSNLNDNEINCDNNATDNQPATINLVDKRPRERICENKDCLHGGKSIPIEMFPSHKRRNYIYASHICRKCQNSVKRHKDKEIDTGDKKIYKFEREVENKILYNLLVEYKNNIGIGELSKKYNVDYWALRSYVTLHNNKLDDRIKTINNRIKI